MLYVSDHGESLGERGFYLHGLPYSIAPDAQKKVPMVLWMSPDFTARFGIDVAALQARSGHEYSHDNLFHSMLGLLDIRTTDYKRELDIFATTHTAAAQVQTPAGRRVAGGL
jgi:lipid A ethanolaminephosphotransferase